MSRPELYESTRRVRKCKHTSVYNEGQKVDAAHRIAEIILQRLADRDGVVLPFRFWERREWKSKFVRQRVEANALLKLYDESAILEALKSKPKVWSLGAGFFYDELERCQAVLDSQREAAAKRPPPERTDTKQGPRSGVKARGKRPSFNE